MMMRGSQTKAGDGNGNPRQKAANDNPCDYD